MRPSILRGRAGSADRPNMAEGIAQLAVAIAPELVGKLNHHCCTGIYRSIPPGIRVRHLQVQHHACRVWQILSAMMFWKMVVHHQRVTVDLQMGMHQAAIIRSVTHQLFGAKCLSVKFNGFGCAACADGEMWCEAACRFLEFKVHSTHSLPSPLPRLIGAALSR